MNEITEFKRKMVALANANNAWLTGRTDEVWQIVNNNDVVVAVWQDDEETDGIGLMIVKGEALLQRTAEWLNSARIRTTAISMEEAQAHVLAGALGEKDTRHWWRPWPPVTLLLEDMLAKLASNGIDFRLVRSRGAIACYRSDGQSPDDPSIE
jgi:hypothetical protein